MSVFQFVVSLPLMHLRNKLLILEGWIRALKKIGRTLSEFYGRKGLVHLEGALMIVPTTS